MSNVIGNMSHITADGGDGDEDSGGTGRPPKENKPDE